MEYENLYIMMQAFKGRMLRQGFDVVESEYPNGLYGILKHNILLVTVMENGEIMRKINTGLDDLTVKIIMDFINMKEAYEVYEKALPLTYEDIQDYRLVSSYGETLLAAKMTKNMEVYFTTWSYDYNHSGVVAGHYYETDYEGAKQDFAIRAGLIDRNKLFEKEQLNSIYDACIFRGINDGEITYDDEKLLREVMEKAEYNLPTRNKQNLNQEKDLKEFDVQME